MSGTTSAKETRINLRINPEHKQLLEKVSSARGLTLSSYITAVVVKTAQEDLLRHQQLTLSNRDRDQLLAVLNADPQPNSVLQDAAAKFRTKYDTPET